MARRLTKRMLLGSVAVLDIVLAIGCPTLTVGLAVSPTAAGSGDGRRAMADPTDDSSRNIPKPVQGP